MQSQLIGIFLLSFIRSTFLFSVSNVLFTSKMYYLSVLAPLGCLSVCSLSGRFFDLKSGIYTDILFSIRDGRISGDLLFFFKFLFRLNLFKETFQVEFAFLQRTPSTARSTCPTPRSRPCVVNSWMSSPASNWWICYLCDFWLVGCVSTGLYCRYTYPVFRIREKILRIRIRIRPKNNIPDPDPDPAWNHSILLHWGVFLIY